MTSSSTLFVEKVWSKLIAQPLGSLTKRELKLILLLAAVDSGLLNARDESVAETFNIPITRAPGYLTDLEIVTALVSLLKDTEVVRDDSHISIPLHDAPLRIWLERKM